MDTQNAGSPRPSEPGPVDVHPAPQIPAPRARLATRLIPAAVLLALSGLLAWSVWPMVHPAREVTVVQAIFDRAQAIDPDTAAAAEAESAPTSASTQPTRQPTRRVPTVQAPGWLEAEPYLTACTALADGVLESIDVLEGDFVERGQIVARLVAEDSELRVRQSEADVANARAAVTRAAADHGAAERTWAEPVELERAIASGRAAVAEAEAELAQLPALIASADATLKRLDDETRRVQRSSEQGAANEFELFNAQQHAAAQRAEVAALRARRPILEARVDRLEADLHAAERNLDLRIEDRRRLDTAAAALATAEAAMLRAQAQRDEAALELDRMTIRAPIAGYVQRRLKVPGDKVIRMMDSPHSAHILHIYDHQRLQVRVDVPLADASHVSVGQTCEVVVEVLPDRVFRGEVLRITHEADLQKNTLQIKVKVIDPAPILRPEMLTRVKFLPPGANAANANANANGTAQDETPERENRQRVLIPAGTIDAPSANATEASLWLVTDRRDGRGTLTPRRVQVLSEANGWLTVAGNVQPGDLIAVGVPNPRPGERVVIGITSTPSRTAPFANREGES